MQVPALPKSLIVVFAKDKAEGIALLRVLPWSMTLAFEKGGRRR